MNYGRGTAFGVGMLHGIGAETPTQVVIFLTAAGAGGPIAGIVILVVFLVGLLSSNTLITFGSAFGLGRNICDRSFDTSVTYRFAAEST